MSFSRAETLVSLGLMERSERMIARKNGRNKKVRKGERGRR
jgi:hypothetical protein